MVNRWGYTVVMKPGKVLEGKDFKTTSAAPVPHLAGCERGSLYFKGKENNMNSKNIPQPLSITNGAEGLVTLYVGNRESFVGQGAVLAAAPALLAALKKARAKIGHLSHVSLCAEIDAAIASAEVR